MAPLQSTGQLYVMVFSVMLKSFLSVKEDGSVVFARSGACNRHTVFRFRSGPNMDYSHGDLYSVAHPHLALTVKDGQLVAVSSTLSEGKEKPQMKAFYGQFSFDASRWRFLFEDKLLGLKDTATTQHSACKKGAYNATLKLVDKNILGMSTTANSFILYSELAHNKSSWKKFRQRNCWRFCAKNRNKKRTPKRTG